SGSAIGGGGPQRGALASPRTQQVGAPIGGRGRAAGGGRKRQADRLPGQTKQYEPLSTVIAVDEGRHCALDSVTSPIPSQLALHPAQLLRWRAQRRTQQPDDAPSGTPRTALPDGALLTAT